jgi:hypothetical protein
MEFINKPLLERCFAGAGRSRPCRKNDNCFADLRSGRNRRITMRCARRRSISGLKINGEKSKVKQASEQEAGQAEAV